MAGAVDASPAGRTAGDRAVCRVNRGRQHQGCDGKSRRGSNGRLCRDSPAVGHATGGRQRDGRSARSHLGRATHVGHRAVGDDLGQVVGCARIRLVRRLDPNADLPGHRPIRDGTGVAYRRIPGLRRAAAARHRIERQRIGRAQRRGLSWLQHPDHRPPAVGGGLSGHGRAGQNRPTGTVVGRHAATHRHAARHAGGLRCVVATGRLPLHVQ